MTVVIKTRGEVRDIFAPLNGELFSKFISERNGDDPLSGWRRNSFALAEKTAAPSNKDEDFKYVDFRKLDFTGLSPITIASRGLANGGSGSALVTSSQSVTAIPEKFAVTPVAGGSGDGTYFASFDSAMNERLRELLEALEFLRKQFPSRKFAQLAHAFMSEGVYYHVGANQIESGSRHILTHLDGMQTITSIVAAAVIDNNARGSLIWDIDSNPDAAGFFNGALEVIVRSGAKIELLLNQELSGQLNSSMTVRVYLEKDSEVEIVSMNSGGRLNQMEIDLQFAGEGTKATVNGVYIGRDEENFNLLTHQDHKFGHSTSDLFYIGTLSGKSKSNYLGKITIAPNAQRSDAYQKNRNLVLNKGVSVNSSPKLEIQANDVRCTHGATTAKVSDLEMFYLRARGIDKVDAKILLADGFLAQVTPRLKSPKLHDAFAKRLSALLAQWKESE